VTTKPQQTFTIQDIELALAQRSFVSFLEHVRILQVAIGGSQGGLIPLEMWGHIREAAVLLAGDETQKIEAKRLISPHLLTRTTGIHGFPRQSKDHPR
jgi:hypothetical protein